MTMSLKEIPKLIIGIFLLLQMLSIDSFANCFRDHMKDAIKVNNERMQRYADLSQGKSLEISKKLISFEKRLLFFSYTFANYDYVSERFVKYGVNITCDDYVSMSTVKVFNDFWPQGKPEPSNYVDFDIKAAKKKLYKAYFANEDLKPVLDETLVLLKGIEKEPRFNCMVRHALESIAQISIMAPKQEEALSKVNKTGAMALAREMAYGHIFMLDNFHELDQMAAPLSAQGLPILCQDIPIILKKLVPQR